jgi:uncharacterized protein involved in high-affinity Fe2+ transport
MTTARRRVLAGSLLVLILLMAAGVVGQGRVRLTPLGPPEFRAGLRVMAGFLPGPITLDPPAGGVPSPAIHLQVDVDATGGNPYGFDPEDSVPYLRIPFTLTLTSGSWQYAGMLEPMVSRAGFHYGATVPLPGPGDYRVTIEVGSPQGLVRHTDSETGVAPWWPPFSLSWPFHYPPEN